jgi:hypothetical protein
MKVGVVYDDWLGRADRFFGVCEAFEGLGHEVVRMDFSGNSFIPISPCVYDIFDVKYFKIWRYLCYIRKIYARKRWSI